MADQHDTILTVTVTSARPSTILLEIAGAVDVDVDVRRGGEDLPGGEATLVPAADGSWRLEAAGDSPDCWLTGALLGALRAEEVGDVLAEVEAQATAAATVAGLPVDRRSAEQDVGGVVTDAYTDEEHPASVAAEAVLHGQATPEVVSVVAQLARALRDHAEGDTGEVPDSPAAHAAIRPLERELAALMGGEEVTRG